MFDNSKSLANDLIQPLNPNTLQYYVIVSIAFWVPIPKDGGHWTMFHILLINDVQRYDKDAQ